jgi:hypothetical protein
VAHHALRVVPVVLDALRSAALLVGEWGASE